MFSKHNKSTKMLCQLKQEAGIVIEPLNRPLIARVEEQRTTALPVYI